MEPGSKWVDPQEKPAKVALFIAAEDAPAESGGEPPPPAVSIGAAGKFYGTIYAPGAALSIPASLQVYGAAVGASMSLAPLSKFHFDTALETAGPEVYLFEQIAWRALEVLPELASDAADPFDALGLDPALVPKKKPYGAHADQLYAIVYVDDAGAVQTYIGLESRFNASLVDSVITEVHEGGPALKTIVKSKKTIAHSNNGLALGHQEP
jgi:hypothetical protein